MKSRQLLYVLPVAIMAAGCHISPEPNPNDPNAVSAYRQPRVLKEYMEGLSGVIADARMSKQITESQGKALMVQGARDYLANVKLKDIAPGDLWMAAEAYIAGEEWQEAKGLLEKALAADTSPNRIVNDTLRYARCCAELGDLNGALVNARKAFAAPPEWKWPILYGVYLEIVPALVKNHPEARIELAKLTEEAIHQHELATGSVNDKDRRDWVMLRQYHINHAWDLVVKLYNDAGRKDLAKAAMARQQAPSTPTLTVGA